MRNFKRTEFSEEIKYTSLELLEALDNYRDLLGKRIYPSTAPGALARTNGSIKSQHYIGSFEDPTRQSTAIDFYTEGHIREAWMLMMTSGLWGGVGVYFDTWRSNKPWCMLHGDTRKAESTVFWFRVEHEYYSPMNNPSHLQKLFNLLSVSG